MHTERDDDHTRIMHNMQFRSSFKNLDECVQFFILSKSIDCPSDTLLEICNSPTKSSTNCAFLINLLLYKCIYLTTLQEN